MAGGLVGALLTAGSSDVAGGQEPPVDDLGSVPAVAGGVPERPNADVPLADSELRQAVTDLVDDGQATTSADVDVEGGRVRVEILHHTTDADIDRIVRSYRGEIDGSVPGVLAEGFVPAANLEALEAEPAVDAIRPPLEVNVPTAGSVTGEEVAKTNADDWQATLGATGAGVKVGIIDVFGTTAWSSAQGSGDVPVPAGTFCRNNGSNCSVFDGGEAHGAGVAEIVHDMAPDAQLYLGSATTTADTQAVVDYFDSQGVQIITRSLTSPYDGPGNGTGPFATVMNNAVADGMAWMQSAGNAAGQVGVRAGSYYRFTFSNPDGDPFVDVGPSGDEFIGFNCGFLNGLRWDDFGSADASDYDLYIYDSGGNLIASSAASQGSANPSVPPIERTTACSGVNFARIQIFDPGAGTAGDVFEFSINGTGLEYWQNPGSASGPAADTRSAGALTVGAIDPANGTTIANYSSQGPTNDGRIKPDISAAACVTSVAFSPNCFNGTSAATPVVAGAAALVLDSGAASTPAQLRRWLLCRAVAERGAAGMDNVYGAGELVLPSTAGTRSCRPDARIRTGAAAPIRGNNVYNATGGASQTVTRTGRAGANLTYTATIQNDGTTPERFKLRGTRSTTKFTVTYRVSGVNRTAPITAGTYLTPLVQPGATMTVSITVKVKNNTVRNSSFTGTLTSTSTYATTVKDAVRFVARRT
jgi:hypothetical protein